MDKLATYVNAILHRPASLAVYSETIEKTSWKDQGFEVRKDVTVHRFSNGVIIQRTVEQDDFPSGLACAECWITYEVISNGDSGLAISPPRQVFENTCREAFWLAYHTT